MKNIEQKNGLAREILTLSRNTLLVSLRFMDVALSQFEWVLTGNGALMTDGKHIFYDPNRVLTCYKIAREIPVRDYLHIVLHCVFQHMYLAHNMDRTYWDLACDIVVEDTISEMGLIYTEAQRVTQQKKVLTDIKRNLNFVTAEKVYVYLREAATPVEIKKLQKLFYADNHQLWYKLAENTPEDSSSDASMDGGPNTGFGAGGPTSEMSKIWKDISQRMQLELETFGKQRGLESGTLTQNLTAVNREKYDYTAFLKRFAVMGEAMKVNDDEFDYIFYTYGLQLYRNLPLIEPLEYKDIKMIQEFVVAIDTSGSTSGELVQKFIQKTYNILKSTESFFKKINLHIIQCDAEIQEDAKITCQEEFDQYLNTMKIRGMGGTDFRPVFEYVEQLQKNHEFTKLKGLIYFTDECGTFPAKKPNYETAFVFVDDNYNNYDVPPWAIKLILQKDEI